MFASTGARSRLVQMTVCRGGTIGVRCRPAQRRTPGGHARRPGIPTRHFKPQTGAPGGIRTPDQWLRKPLLYPAELQAPGRLLSTIAPGCASRVRFAHVLRTRSEEHTSELQSLMRISYAVFCLKKKTNTK